MKQWYLIYETKNSKLKIVQLLYDDVNANFVFNASDCLNYTKIDLDVKLETMTNVIYFDDEGVVFEGNTKEPVIKYFKEIFWKKFCNLFKII